MAVSSIKITAQIQKIKELQDFEVEYFLIFGSFSAIFRNLWENVWICDVFCTYDTKNVIAQDAKNQ